MRSKTSLKEDMQGIANLVQYSEEYPEGAVKIGYHYYNISALIDVLKDLRTRSAIGDITKTDKLMMQILAGLI